MKNPEEHLDYYLKFKHEDRPNLVEMFRLIQKDAYNQALDDFYEHYLLNGELLTTKDLIENLKIK